MSHKRTHDPADGVVRAGEGLNLALEHSLLMDGEWGGSTHREAAAHLQAHFLPNRSQGVLQTEGTRKRGDEGARRPQYANPGPDLTRMTSVWDLWLPLLRPYLLAFYSFLTVPKWLSVCCGQGLRAQAGQELVLYS